MAGEIVDTKWPFVLNREKVKKRAEDWGVDEREIFGFFERYGEYRRQSVNLIAFNGGLTSSRDYASVGESLTTAAAFCDELVANVQTQPLEKRSMVVEREELVRIYLQSLENALEVAYVIARAVLRKFANLPVDVLSFPELFCEKMRFSSWLHDGQPTPKEKIDGRKVAEEYRKFLFDNGGKIGAPPLRLVYAASRVFETMKTFEEIKKVTIRGKAFLVVGEEIEKGEPVRKTGSRVMDFMVAMKETVELDAR